LVDSDLDDSVLTMSDLDVSAELAAVFAGDMVPSAVSTKLRTTGVVLDWGVFDTFA